MERPNIDDLRRATSEIEGGSWASGTQRYSSAPGNCSQLPNFPGILAPFVQPLESMLIEFSGDPGAVYQASMAWEGATGNLADMSADLKSLAKVVDADLRGKTADALIEALTNAAEVAHVTGNATKVVAQSLQVCVTIFESVRSMICESLLLLTDFVKTAWDVLFGSWPWEIEKKADAINEFAASCFRFASACNDLARNALKAAQELIRLITDMARLLLPEQTRWLETAIAAIAKLVPGGTAPAIPAGKEDSSNGAQYNPTKTPYPGSDLKFEKDYPLGYQHKYGLGPTDLTTEELNEIFKNEFGHLFIPSRVGDNSQLNMQLTEEGQRIRTSLFGTSIDEITTGSIYVQQIGSDGFVIAAEEGHPEYPGEVAFRITNQNGYAQLEVTGVYNDTILGKHDFGLPIDTNGVYAGISDYSIWSDMQGRIRDRLTYG